MLYGRRKNSNRRRNKFSRLCKSNTQEKVVDFSYVFWLNSNYLIFNLGNHLKIVEIDDRDRIQTLDITPTTNLGGGNNPEIYFNGNNRKLYILSQGNLFVSEKLF